MARDTVRPFEAATGRGVRVAIVDSGVHASHAHVGGVAGGIAIDEHGREHGDYVDRLGHGTAVTAAIKEKAPDAELFAVKVFDRTLSTSITSLVRAIDWAAESGMHLVNLSLGTSREQHEAALAGAVGRAAARGVLIVSARGDGGVRWLPGDLPGVISVQVDWACPRDEYHVAQIDGVTVFQASGFAREIPGVPPERNLNGISFAVANMTGFVARAWEAAGVASLDAIVRTLERGCRFHAIDAGCAGSAATNEKATESQSHRESRVGAFDATPRSGGSGAQTGRRTTM